MAAGVSLPVLLLMVSTVVECASGVGGLQLTPLGPGWRFQASSHSPSSLKPPIVRAAFGGAWDEELRVAAELALEAGAHDVVSNDDNTIEVRTTLESFGPTQDALTASDLRPESAEMTMIASTEVELDLAGAEKLLKLVEHLEDLDDVQNVYSNASISDDIASQL